MSEFVHSEPRPGVLTLGGEMTIGYAREMRDVLLHALSRHEQLEIDLLNVTTFDTAGVQLLLLLHHEANACGKPLHWLGYSLAVEEVLELLNLAEILGQR